MVEVTHGYCTVDDLREQLGDLGRGNLSERQLVRAVNAASRAIDEYTDRRFWADTAVVARTIPVTTCEYELWLQGVDAGDIAYSAGLIIATDDNGDGSYATVWDATDYRLWPYSANTSGSTYGGWWKIESTGRKRFDIHGTNGVSGILPLRITARFGWAFVPAQVEMACLLIATRLFKRKDAPYGVAQFGDIAAVQIVRTDRDVQEMLWPFMRDVAMVG